MSATTLERQKAWVEARRNGIEDRSGYGATHVMYPEDAPPPQASSWDGWPVGWNVPNWNGYPDYVFGRVATVFCCVDLIGRSLGSMSLVVTKNSEPQLPRPWSENPEPEVYAHAGEWTRATVNSLLLRGEAFVIASARFADGYPARFFTANPDAISVEVVDGRVRYSIIGSREEIPRADILHLRYQLWPGLSYRGIGPLQAAALNLLGAEAMARYAADLAARGGVPWGAIKHPANLSAEQATALQARWIAASRDRLGAPAVLSGGIELEMFNLSPREMTLLELRQWDEQRIAATFGVPPYLVGLPQPEGSLTYNNVQSLFDFFWRSTLRPLATNIGDGLSAWLLPRGTGVHYDSDEYVRPSLTERVPAYVALVQAGIVTADEVRVFENLPPNSSTEATEVLGETTQGVA